MTVYAMNENPDFVVTAWVLPEVDGNDLDYFINDSNTPAWAATLMSEEKLILADNAGEIMWKIIFVDEPPMTAFSSPENILCMRGDGTEIPEYNSTNYLIWGTPAFYDTFSEVTA